ncbi:MAG: flippase-like domain-containing protein [Actinomycetaceae bacterium]|nr:flippase-like domain-containing protein [Actinomycetaceae bacterium]
MPTLVLDHTRPRTRNKDDLVRAGMCALLLLLLLVLKHFADTGVAIDYDVKKVSTRIGSLIIFPLHIAENTLLIAAPVVLVVGLLASRRWGWATRAMGCALVGGFVAAGGALLPVIGFTLHVPAAALAAALSTMGSLSQFRLVRWGWALTYAAIGVSLLQTHITISEALVSILIGRFVGLAGRYIVGMETRRVSGAPLLEALRQRGYHPLQLVRIDAEGETGAGVLENGEAKNAPTPETVPGNKAETDLVMPPENTAGSATGTVAGTFAETSPPEQNLETPPEPLQYVTKVPGFQTRTYAMSEDGRWLRIVALDNEQSLLGWLHSLWANARLRGVGGTPVRGLQQKTERATLMALAAQDAGVRTPALLDTIGLGETALLVYEMPRGAQMLRIEDDSNLTESAAVSLWRQLKSAHAKGIAHGNLQPGSILINGSQTWICDFEQGQVGATTLTREIDLAQMLVLQVLALGWERALSIARNQLNEDALAQIVPLLQSVVLPAELAQRARARGLLPRLREELYAGSQELPELAPLRRWGWKKLAMVFVGTGVLVIVLGSFNPQGMKQAVMAANPTWILVAALCSFTTYLAAAWLLQLLTPEPLQYGRTLQVQVAASVLGIVTPAGIGPAALNLRYLQKSGIKPAESTATVALTQILQVAVSSLLFVIMVVTTGLGENIRLPSRMLTLILTALAATIAVIAIIPATRKQLPALVKRWFERARPRFLWVMANPRRLATSIGCVLLHTLGYILTFAASLEAFGYHLPFTKIAVGFLTGNTIGAAIPTPGGLGPTEAALTGTLNVFGIPTGIALSTTLLYRLLTYWLPALLGWLTLKDLERKNRV